MVSCDTLDVPKQVADVVKLLTAVARPLCPKAGAG